MPSFVNSKWCFTCITRLQFVLQFWLTILVWTYFTAGGQLLPPCRRSKRLQRERTEKQELSSRESQHDVFVNSEDGKSEFLTDVWIRVKLLYTSWYVNSKRCVTESKTFIQQRRPNCLRKRFISEYYSGELAEDKHTSRSSSDYGML